MVRRLAGVPSAISRRDNGDWVLHGAPPEQLRNHRLVAALT